MEVPTYSVPIEPVSYIEPADKLKKAQAAYREIRSTKWNASPEKMFEFLGKLRNYADATRSLGEEL